MNSLKKFGLLGLLSALPFVSFSQKDSTNFSMRFGITGKDLGVYDGKIIGWSSTGQIKVGDYFNFEASADFLKNSYALYGKRPTITNIDIQAAGNLTTNNKKKFFGILGAGVEYSDIIYNSSDENIAGRTCQVNPIGKVGAAVKIGNKNKIYFYFKRDFRNDLNQYSVEFEF